MGLRDSWECLRHLGGLQIQQRGPQRQLRGPQGQLEGPQRQLKGPQRYLRELTGSQRYLKGPLQRQLVGLWGKGTASAVKIRPYKHERVNVHNRWFVCYLSHHSKLRCTVIPDLRNTAQTDCLRSSREFKFSIAMYLSEIVYKNPIEKKNRDNF